MYKRQHTHTHTHMQTVHSAPRPTSPHRDYRLATHTHRQTCRRRDRQRDGRTDITHLTVTTGYQYTHTHRQTDGQTDRQRHKRHSQTQTNVQGAGGQTDTHRLLIRYFLRKTANTDFATHSMATVETCRRQRRTFSYADKTYDGNRCSDL